MLVSPLEWALVMFDTSLSAISARITDDLEASHIYSPFSDNATSAHALSFRCTQSLFGYPSAIASCKWGGR